MTNAVLTRPLLSVRSAAARLSVSEKTVRRLIDGGLPALRVGGQVRIDAVELECWIRGWEPPPGYEAAGNTGAARSPRSGLKEGGLNCPS
jgi:excisionase family DNA binding protein